VNFFGNFDGIPWKFQETNITDSSSIFDKAAKTDGKKADEKNGFLFKKFGECFFSYSHKL